MSLDEYNRHATFGPAAGPATNAAASAGQDAWNRAHQGPSRVQGIYVAPPPTEPPRWLRDRPFRRGLIIMAIALFGQLLSAALIGPRAWLLTAICSVVFLAGLFVTGWGIMDWVSAKRRGTAPD